MKRLGAALVIAIFVPAVSLSALADKPGPDKPAAAPKRPSDGGAFHDPENVKAISEYMEMLVAANAKVAAKELSGAGGAIDRYKTAISLAPKNPLAHYLLGEAHLLAGNLTEAEASLHEAAETSDSKTSSAARLRSHVLFAVARCFEQQKKWPEANAAWQAYAEHGAKVPDAGAFPASAAARIQAIEKVLEQEKAYAAVRERIAKEAADGGAKTGANAAATKKK